VKTHDANRQPWHAFFAIICFPAPESFPLCGSACPQESLPAARTISPGEMFTFFFLMLGPLKILGPFVQLAGQGDTQFARRLALLFAAVIGERSMRQYHVSEPVLAIAAGIILFLVALKTIMEQFRSTVPAPQQNLEPSLGLAISPLAFPTIVTPYGVAAVIICMALTPDFLTKGAIFALFSALCSSILPACFSQKRFSNTPGCPCNCSARSLASSRSLGDCRSSSLDCAVSHRLFLANFPFL
jgi:small neutral amino acid transporter SnatA (MarC family)